MAQQVLLFLKSIGLGEPTDQLTLAEGGVACWLEGILAFAENAGIAVDDDIWQLTLAHRVRIAMHAKGQAEREAALAPERAVQYAMVPARWQQSGAVLTHRHEDAHRLRPLRCATRGLSRTVKLCKTWRNC